MKRAYAQTLVPLVGCFLAVSASAGGLQRIYIASMSHTDIGFTDAPSAVAEKMVATVNEALAAAEQDPAFVWNVETFWQLDQWLATKPAAEQQQRLAALVRAGRIGVGAAYATPHSAFLSNWAWQRWCEPAQDWARANGLRLEWAVLNDVPGHPGDTPAHLARAGVKYLVMGINQGFTPPLPEKFCNTPFWWEAPTGERVLAWIAADAYTEAFTKLGIDPDAARFFNPDRFKGDDPLAIMHTGIDEAVAQYEKRGYRHEAILAMHAFDNWGLGSAAKLPDCARRWNEAGQRPQVVIATPGEFFRDILDDGVELPVYRGGFGGAWDRVKLAAPTAVRHLRAAEEVFRAENRTAADPLVRTYLALCEHSFGYGACWPGLLTEEQVRRHNRDEAAMVRSLPGRPQPWPVRGEPVIFDVAHSGKPFPNGLYLAKGGLMWQFVGEALEPLPEDAWTALPPRRTAEGTWQFRHRINRERLPDDAHVVWAWSLQSPVAKIRPRVRTASGWMQIPEDLLEGRHHNGWFSSWATQVDGVEIEADVPLAFCISPEHYPQWVFALCLSQSRTAEFKGGQKRRLTFAEAYPDEEEVLELTFEVRPVGAGKKDE